MKNALIDLVEGAKEIASVVMMFCSITVIAFIFALLTGNAP